MTFFVIAVIYDHRRHPIFNVSASDMTFVIAAAKFVSAAAMTFVIPAAIQF